MIEAPRPTEAQLTDPWDQAVISVALKSEHVDRVHHAHGRGTVHRIGQGDNVADVDIYPRGGRGVVRYTSAFATFSIHDIDPPECQAREGDERGSCIFGHTDECGHTAAVIYDTGEFLLAGSDRSQSVEGSNSAAITVSLDSNPEPVERISQGAHDADVRLATPVMEREVERLEKSPEPVPASERPDPWDTDLPAGRQGPAGLSRNGDDERLGGGVEPQYPGSIPAAESAAPSTEPTTFTPEGGLTSPDQSTDGRSKEQQPRIKITGNVTQPPVLRRSPRGVPRVNFSVTEQETQEVRSVYSTKQNAEGINNQQLQAGELVRVNGVVHQREQRDTQGHPVTNANGEVVTENVVYAFGVRRLQEENR